MMDDDDVMMDDNDAMIVDDYSMVDDKDVMVDGVSAGNYYVYKGHDNSDDDDDDRFLNINSFYYCKFYFVHAFFF
jgi:hypothetical protein